MMVAMVLVNALLTGIEGVPSQRGDPIFSQRIKKLTHGSIYLLGEASNPGVTVTALSLRCYPNSHVGKELKVVQVIRRPCSPKLHLLNNRAHKYTIQATSTSEMCII
jgi:hypothetical protein